MRHIDLSSLLAEIFADDAGQKIKKSLERAHGQVLRKRTPKTRKGYVDANGGRKWKPVKNQMTQRLGNKCWYTEVELIGAPLAIDHYRPVHHYWWLAFDPENYRVACPWANSPAHNAKHGRAGGKGDNFPLLDAASSRAKRKSQLVGERPVILDPCVAEDCNLLVFGADGRPALNPEYSTDAEAKRRVDESSILLNLDHPDFNAKREQLCNYIKSDVEVYEELPAGSAQRDVIRQRLSERLAITAPFSTAARQYLQFYRHLDWVEDILSHS
jgi:hypothetical protein